MPDSLSLDPAKATPSHDGCIWKIEYEIPPLRAIYFAYVDGVLTSDDAKAEFAAGLKGRIREMSRVVQEVPLRVLSLWQPWATLMAVREKELETRSWETLYRGHVAIQAAAKWNRDLAALCIEQPFRAVLAKHGVTADNMPLGKVVAVGRLESIIRTSEFNPHMSRAPHERDFGDYGPGRFAWVFKDVRRLLVPIPLKASQGLFHAPAVLRAQIAQQLPDLNLV